MSAFLKAADLTQDKFLTLVTGLRLPDADELPGYLWLEAPDGWAFDEWSWQPDPEGQLHWRGAGREPVEERTTDCLGRSTTGRLFAPDGELHWRTVLASDGELRWRTVFLGRVDWVGAALDDHSDILDNLHSRRDEFFLWGQQTDETPDEWVTLRIPHRFRYPVNGNPDRVKVVVERWSDDVGEPHFVRLCNLKSS